MISVPRLRLISIAPGRGPSLGGLGLGAPRVPPPEPAFPFLPGPWEGPGSVMNPVTPLAYRWAIVAPARGLRGEICLLPCG